MDRSPSRASSSSTKQRLLSPSSRQPRWRTPSPMAASIIPPPIVQSVQSLPSRQLAQSILVAPPSPLQDRQTELEADLQFLLDAQAEGLVRGLEGGGQDDQTSTGSTTPTAPSPRSGSAMRARKTTRRRLGLRSARKGIYNAIIALSALKDDELADIDGDINEKDTKLKKIEAWEKKRQGLQEAAKAADQNDESVRVQRLKSEANILQEEINAVELQLADMKARHRKLLRQVSAIDNSVQAKLASYTSSLRMLEEDVQRFLSIEPEEEENGTPSSRDGGGAANGMRTSMWQLPAKRRTLEMAREQFSEERAGILEQKKSVEHERTALDEGAEVWKDVVAQVNDFETRLRAEMQALSTPQSSTAPPQSQPEKLQELLKHLDELLETLDSKFQLSKDRTWNLLVAAIGAELDALRQGRQILENVLQSPPEEHVRDLLHAPQPEPLLSNIDSGNEIDALDKNFDTAASRRRMSNGTDDDDPDPELLFSKHDTDTESPE